MHVTLQKLLLLKGDQKMPQQLSMPHLNRFIVLRSTYLGSRFHLSPTILSVNEFIEFMGGRIHAVDRLSHGWF